MVFASLGRHLRDFFTRKMSWYSEKRFELFTELWYRFVNYLLHHSHEIRVIIVLLLAALFSSACERDTRLIIEEGNPPGFVMSGSGTLGFLRIRGPKKQREAVGEDASIYWEIEPKDEDSDRNVGRLSPITYGKVPDGYTQVYPEQGQAAPPLVEGERYNIRIATNNANGVNKSFEIRQGKAVVSEF
jgi:hypothetical protein